MIFRKPFPRKRMWGSNRNCFGVSLREINFLFVTKTVRRKTAKSVCWSKERKANASSVDRPIGTAPQSSAVFLLFETFSSFVPFYILPLHYVFNLKGQKQNDFERDDGFIKTSSFLQSLLKTCCTEQDRNAGTKQELKVTSGHLLS